MSQISAPDDLYRLSEPSGSTRYRWADEADPNRQRAASGYPLEPEWEENGLDYLNNNAVADRRENRPDGREGGAIVTNERPQTVDIAGADETAPSGRDIDAPAYSGERPATVGFAEGSDPAVSGGDLNAPGYLGERPATVGFAEGSDPAVSGGDLNAPGYAGERPATVGFAEGSDPAVSGGDLNAPGYAGERPATVGLAEGSDPAVAGGNLNAPGYSGERPATVGFAEGSDPAVSGGNLNAPGYSGERPATVGFAEGSDPAVAAGNLNTPGYAGERPATVGFAEGSDSAVAAGNLNAPGYAGERPATVGFAEGSDPAVSGGDLNAPGYAGEKPATVRFTDPDESTIAAGNLSAPGYPGESPETVRFAETNEPAVTGGEPAPSIREYILLPSTERPPEVPPNNYEDEISAAIASSDAGKEAESTGPVVTQAVEQPAPEVIGSGNVPATAQEPPPVSVQPTTPPAGPAVTQREPQISRPPVAEPPQANLPFRLTPNLERGKYYIQLGAYGSVENVQSIINSLGSGYPVVINPSTTAANPVYRLLLGPLNLGESGAMLARVKSLGFTDAFMRREP
jgi:cell division septation protein DedD